MKKMILASALLIAGCGVSDGYSTSGVTSTETYIYVANYGSSTISSFFLQGTDLVRTASSLPTGSGTSNPNMLVSVPNYNFLVSVNYISANLSVYSIASSTITSGGGLTALSPTFSFAAGAGASSAVSHPSSPWIYTTHSGAGGANISMKTMSASGVLTATSTASAGTNPYAIAMHPSGNFLYVANMGSNNVSGFSINASTGALAALAGSPFSASTSPQAIAMDPLGRFLYVLNTGANSISAYTINSTTGVLTATTPATFAGDGSSPSRLAIHPSGTFLYLSNSGSNDISAFSINSSTGNLTAVSGSPFNGTGLTQPLGIAVSPDGTILAVGFGGQYKLALFSIDPSTGALTSADSTAVIGDTPRSILFRQQPVTR